MNGTLDGTVLGFRPCTLKMEKQLRGFLGIKSEASAASTVASGFGCMDNGTSWIDDRGRVDRGMVGTCSAVDDLGSLVASA